MRFNLISIFSVLIFSCLFQQVHADELTNGYYINLNNDTVYVQFDIPLVVNGLNKKLVNFEKIQCSIPFVNSNSEKSNINPEDAKLVVFNWERKEVSMFSKNSSTLKRSKGQKSCKKIFLQREIDGYLKLFYYYYTHSGPGMQDVGYRKYYLQKADDILFAPKAGIKHFSKEMSEYLSDCKYVGNQIASKKLRENDLLQIITDYNSACDR